VLPETNASSGSFIKIPFRNMVIVGHQRLIPVILATQELEIQGDRGLKPAWAKKKKK
jgi:hypothetical protein